MKKSRERLSLQSRISVFYCISFFSALLPLALLLHLLITRNLQSYVDKKLSYRARLLGHIWIEESAKGRAGLARRMNEDVAISDLYIVIFDENGQALYERNIPHFPITLGDGVREEILQKGRHFSTLRRNFNFYRALYMDIREGERLFGFIYLEEPLHFLNRFNRAFLVFVPPIFLFLAGTTLLAGRLLGRNVVRSIDSISAAADRLEADRLTSLLDTSGLEREFLPLAERFNAMCRRLNASFDNLRRFASDASHQLRTPLAILKNNFEVVLRSERTPVEYAAAMSSALEEIDRMSKIVNGLLLLTRSESGENVFQKTGTDLSVLVRETAEFLSPLMEEKGLRLETSLEGTAPLTGDPEWLRQLVFNILDNAVKFCRPGDAIRISLEKSDGRLLLRISDTGPGIARECLPHVFERFYKTSDSAKLGGSGIGLTLCQWVARGHDGDIGIESEPGKGTTVRVSLPSA